MQGELIAKTPHRTRTAGAGKPKPGRHIPTITDNAFIAANAAGLNYAIMMVDPGLDSGFSIRTADGQIKFGGKSFRPPPGVSYGHAWQTFYNTVKKLIREHSIRVIYFEEVFSHGQGGTRAAHVYGAWRCMLEMLGFQESIRLVPIGVQAIKISLTGSGSANKHQMIAKARSLGYNVSDDDNVADSLGGLHAAVAIEIGWKRQG